MPSKAEVLERMPADRGDGAATVEGPLRSRSTALSPDRGRAILAIIMAVGLMLRFAWMVTQAPVISSDGGEYATMAENLLQRHALVGTYEGPEILYAPLYPVLIAATMLVTGNSETAAHVVSLLSGTALIAVVFLVAQRLYDRRTACVSAALVAIHPLLIALSASVYNETLYLTLWMVMVYWGLHALERRRLIDSLVLGVIIGLVYLTRVEALAYVPLFAAALLMAWLLRKDARAAAVHVAILCASFLAVASPYVGFLYNHTDGLRLQAKWDINYTMARNRLAGKSYMEADYGLGPDLTVEGPLLGPFQFVNFTPYSHAVADQLKTVASVAQRNARAVYYYLLELELGSPMLWGLLIVGLFRQSWTNTRLRNEALLLVLTGSIVFVTLTSATGEERYVFPILPVLLVWSGKGLQELAQWIAGWELLRDRRRAQPGSIAAALQLGAAGLIVALSIQSVRHDFYFASERGGAAAAAREAGLWLAQQGPGPKRIVVSRSAVIPYYAKGTLIAFPWGDSDATRRYIAGKQVDFVVLESEEASLQPIIGEWIAHGIPDPRARLLYDRTSSTGDRIMIYRWLNP